MSNQIVFARDGQLLTTSETIAAGVNVQHKNLLALVRTYKADFETFGTVAFETRGLNGTADYAVFALLNEQQATLLVTYCKNTATVRKFKVALVKAFYDMRMQLQTPALACDTITPTEQHAIQVAVAKRARRTASNYQTIYRAIKNRYQIARYDQLLRSQFQDCLVFIDEVDLSVPESNPAVREPDSEIRKGMYLSDAQANTLRNFVYCINYLFRDDFQMIYKLMCQFESPKRAHFYEVFNNFTAMMLENTLAQAGYSVTELDCYKYWATKNA